MFCISILSDTATEKLSEKITASALGERFRKVSSWQVAPFCYFIHTKQMNPSLFTSIE